MRELTPERWRRIDELFEAALEEPAERRLEWLARACAGDAELHDAVARLLSKVEPAERALGESVTDYADTLLAELALAATGDVAAAERLLLDSHAALLADRGPDDYVTRVARENLERFHPARGERRWSRRRSISRPVARGRRMSDAVGDASPVTDRPRAGTSTPASPRA